MHGWRRRRGKKADLLFVNSLPEMGLFKNLTVYTPVLSWSKTTPTNLGRHCNVKQVAK
jgi:hypothetical protein